MKKVGIAAAAMVLAALIFIGSGTLARALYPRPYLDLTAQECVSQGLDWDLVYAVIRTESHFRPAAQSRAGACGLMQLTPETYRWLRSLEGREGEGDIFDPQENIHYGCVYLAMLLRQYEGDLPTALAAYNAGMGNVARWLENPAYSPDGRTLETIPFPETARYVEKVRRDRAHYAAAYGGPEGWAGVWTRFVDIFPQKEYTSK